MDTFVLFKVKRLAQACVAQWTACQPANQRDLVRFPIRVQAWVAGQVPNSGRMRGNHTLMFLSLPPPL